MGMARKIKKGMPGIPRGSVWRGKLQSRTACKLSVYFPSSNRYHCVYIYNTFYCVWLKISLNVSNFQPATSSCWRETWDNSALPRTWKGFSHACLSHDCCAFHLTFAFVVNFYIFLRTFMAVASCGFCWQWLLRRVNAPSNPSLS